MDPDGYRSYFRDLRKEPQILSHRQAGGGGVMVWAEIGYYGNTEIKFMSGKMESSHYITLIDEQLEKHAVKIVQCAAKSGGSVVEHHPSYWEQPFNQPYFDNTTKRDTTTTVGQTAFLPCRVRNLGDRAVSWIRKRDLHILTVGILTYTTDQRFQTVHRDGSDEWTLKISSPQLRDSGTYECQVSTESKISQAFNLSVVVSKAKINGNSELYIKSGSDINLTCIVLQTPEPPSFIYW
ncbi:limbic system-associated membrane protein-like [Frieseomelitta varia]|uniref:limbic system-associated membrane protein-like n=1 Tax=Frieseomelitta varia TaxID=561572 RepID=UPI001CB69B3E|nr:limbic system-associated membrane protein-like [Frieseomelitta varia]